MVLALDLVYSSLGHDVIHEVVDWRPSLGNDEVVAVVLQEKSCDFPFSVVNGIQERVPLLGVELLVEPLGLLVHGGVLFMDHLASDFQLFYLCIEILDPCDVFDVELAKQVYNIICLILFH